jgi:hypothetical protein
MIAFKCINGDVLRAFFQLRLVLAAGLVAAGIPVHADDPKPTAPPGYKMVPIHLAGGHTSYIEVKEAANNGSDSTPNGSGFNMTSSMANKTFLPTGGSGQDSAYQDKVQDSFATKSYFPANDTDHAMPGLHDAGETKSYSAYSRAADGFDKSFQTTAADEQAKSSSLDLKKADESDRTASMGGQDIKKFAYNDSDKTYTGPETRAVQRDLDRLNQGLESLKDLPDRPLTIDEVRALIDHGVKPNLDEKPAAPSKPLNAPDYTPDAAPAPLRNSVQPGHLKDDNDLMTPGAVSHPDQVVPDPAPENAEPLPQ